MEYYLCSQILNDSIPFSFFNHVWLFDKRNDIQFLFCAQKPICLSASAFQFLNFESYFLIVMILCPGAPAGTACTVTSTDPNQQGNCQAADFCTSEEGNLYPSGDCWQAPYNGGGSGGSQGPPAWGCCIGNIFHSMLI